MSQIAIAENKLDAARKHLNSEYNLLKTMDCPERLSKHYSNYSTLYNFLNKQDSAVYVSLLGLEAAEAAKDTLTQIRLGCNIGAFFDQMGQFDQVLKYELKALKLAKRHNDPYSKAMVFTQISGTYLEQFNKTGKKEYLKRSLETAQEGLKNANIVQQLPLALDAYNVISKAFGIKKEYSRSIAYADSILLNTPRGMDLFNRNLQEAFLRKSEAYYALGKYQLAKS
ncbi:MAG: hypothetical protein ACOVO3_06795, partial [Fluviicola sp.]